MTALGYGLDPHKLTQVLNSLPEKSTYIEEVAYNPEQVLYEDTLMRTHTRAHTHTHTHTRTHTHTPRLATLLTREGASSADVEGHVETDTQISDITDMQRHTGYRQTASLQVASETHAS